MPYDTLETIHDSKLPMLFTCATEADVIRSYVAAGLVIADFQIITTDMPKGARPRSTASVVAITPAGRKAIERLRAGRSMKQYKKIAAR
jgi:hypothetical protein